MTRTIKLGMFSLYILISALLIDNSVARHYQGSKRHRQNTMEELSDQQQFQPTETEYLNGNEATNNFNTVGQLKPTLTNDDAGRRDEDIPARENYNDEYSRNDNRLTTAAPTEVVHNSRRKHTRTHTQKSSIPISTQPASKYHMLC